MCGVDLTYSVTSLRTRCKTSTTPQGQGGPPQCHCFPPFFCFPLFTFLLPPVCVGYFARSVSNAASFASAHTVVLRWRIHNALFSAGYGAASAMVKIKSLLHNESEFSISHSLHVSNMSQLCRKKKMCLSGEGGWGGNVVQFSCDNNIRCSTSVALHPTTLPPP